MKERAGKMFVTQINLRLPQAHQRFIQLYTEINKPEEASKWRKELAAHNKKYSTPPPEKKP